MLTPRLFLLVVIIVLSLDRAYSQGELLPNGQSGLGFACGISASRQATSYGVSSGYSLAGRFDLGFSVGRVSVIRTSTGATIPTTRGTYVSPSVTCYVLRQKESAHDASLGITVAYEHLTYNPTYALSGNESVYSGGIVFFQDVLQSPSFKLQPNLDLTVSSGRTLTVIPVAGIFFGLKDTVGKIAGVTISVGYQSSAVLWGLEVAAVL